MRRDDANIPVFAQPRRNAIALAFLCGAILLAGFGCGGERRRDDDSLRIVVSVAPLLWPARALAPSDARVSAMIPPGVSPHGYEPPPGAVGELLRADVVVLVGAGLDAGVENTLRARSDRNRAVIRLARFAPRGDDHKHDGARHFHAGDPHLWLDPAVIKRLIPALAEAIRAVEAERGVLSDAEKTRIANEQERLIEQVEEVDHQHRETIAGFAERGVVTLHPAYGRWTQRYGLKIIAVGSMHGVEPTSTQVTAAAEALRTGRAAAILMDPRSSRRLAERLAEATGAPIATLDPIGADDWPTMMRANLRALAEAMRVADESASDVAPSETSEQTGSAGPSDRNR